MLSKNNIFVYGEKKVLILLISVIHGRSQPKIKGGANFLKLIYSAVFNDGKKLEG